MRGRKGTSKFLTDFWYKNYIRNDLCGLCGNSGVIDTTGVRSPAGVLCGDKMLCICPNGQIMRADDVDPHTVRTGPLPCSR